MRKENGFLQRLGALLLTAAMLIGMCPLRVAAEGPVIPLTVKLSGKVFDSSGSPVPRDSYDERNRDTYKYQFSASVDGLLRTGDAKYYWNFRKVADYFHTGSPSNPGGYFPDYFEGLSSIAPEYRQIMDDHVSVCVEVDGLLVEAQIDHFEPINEYGDMEGRTETFRIQTNGWVYTFLEKYVGIPFTIPAPNCMKTSATIDTTDSTSNDDLFDRDGDKYIPKTTGQGYIHRSHSVNGTVRGEESQGYIVKWPNYGAKFEVDGEPYGGNDHIYVSEAKAVTVTIPKETSNGTIADSKYLPNIGTWSETVDGKGWTTTVNNVDSDLTVGNEKLKVTLDSETPTVNVTSAYVDGSETVVKFAYTVGDSGIGRLTINGTDYTSQTTSNPATIKIPGTDKTSVEVKLTSKAGKEGTASCAVTPALSASLGALDAGTKVSGNYINKESSIRVNVSGVPSSGSASVSVPGDSTIYDVSGEVATLPFSANGKTVTVTDSLGRTATVDIPSYTWDNKAPVVKIEVPADGCYSRTDQKVTVTVTDAGAGVNNANVTLEFTNKDAVHETINSATPDGKYEYALTNEDHLTCVTVKNIEDKVGNTGQNVSRTASVIIDTDKPVITLTPSENVTGFYTATDGKKWATLTTPVTDNGSEGTETVTFTATITDPNLPETIEGWTKVDSSKKFVKTFSAVVQNQKNGQLTISIPAADLAGNVADAVTVTASDGSTMTFAETSKVVGGTLYIDRRIPSGSETGTPVVTFGTKDKNYGTADSELYKDSVTFTATIQDGGSGISQVTPGVNFGTVVQGTVVGTKYPFTVTAPTDSETDNADLSVEVSDNVGNTYTYTHAFAIDAKDPVVAVTPNIEAKAENAGVKYYDADVTYTVTATDAFAETTVMEKNGEVFTGLSGGQFTVADKMDSFKVSLTDKVGKTSSVSVGKMVVDKVDPVITVTIKDAGGKTVAPADRVVNSNLTYYFTVTEANLESLTLKYTIYGKAEQTKTLTDFTQTSADQRTFSVTLEDAQRMTSWSVEAKDWAGRSASAVKSSKDNLLVDTTKPSVVVTSSTATPISTSAKAKFFDQEITYTVTVSDANLDSAAISAVVRASNSDTTQTVAFTESTTEGGTVPTYTYTVEDGMMLSDIVINVVDKAGNRPDSITGFKTDGDVLRWEDNTPGVVVDTTAPEAVLTIASKTPDVTVTGIYSVGTTNYLKLEGNKGKDVEVEATLELTDANLKDFTLDGWTGQTATSVNRDTTVTLTATLSAAKDKTNAIGLSLTALDAVGKALVSGNVDGGVGNTKPAYQTAEQSVVFNLTLDNRAPTSGSDSDAPVITVSPSTLRTTADNKPLYSDSVTFEATVNETTAHSSGLHTVYYAVTDGARIIEEVNNESSKVLAADADKSSMKLSIPAALTGDYETNSANLTIQAIDQVGNTVDFGMDFAVDRQKPSVSVKFNNNNVTNSVYFNAPRTATVTVKDINLTETVAAVSGSNSAFDGAWTGTVSEKVNTVTFDPGDDGVGEYTMSLSSTDRANNTTNDGNVDYATDGCIAPNSFIIDRKAPTVEVTRTSVATGYTTTAGTDKTDFYNQPVTYTFTIQDNYLENAAGGSQKLNISYTLNGAEKQVSLPASTGLVYTRKDGLDTYTYSFTLNNDDVLSGITVEVVDNAGNRFQQITGNVSFTNGTYTGNKVKVDTEAPVVKVERTGGAAVQTVDGYEIFGQAQTFTVTVMDKNLVDTNGSIYKVHYILDNENGEQSEQEVLLTGDTTRAGSFEVTGSVSDLIQLIQLLVKDAAGNSAVLDGTSNVSFGKVEGKEGLVNTGNKMVVDTLAPTATFYAKGPEIDYYYTNGSGAVFIKLTNPTDGTETDKGDVEVTACLEISDWNLSFNKAEYTVQSNNGGTLAGSDADDWNEGVKIHKDGKVVYTKTFSVPYNETRLIQLNMDISDMAGHKLEQSGLTIQSLNGTMPDKYPLTVTNGKLTGAITLDRRQPTSGSDTAAPYIEMKPTAESKYTTSSNGRKLFNKDFAYSLYVTDGEDMTLNAGLRSVVWTLENAAGVNSPSFITVNSGNGHIDQGVMKTNETISFTVGTDECNTCELHVTAEDYVGNKITYVELFAVDRLAPRVKVEYDNNDVKNELYFKADRKATIFVEDINFDASATNISTQVGSSGWTHSADGLVHTAVCSYTVDGDYTFRMESTDLAGNAATDNNVTYVGAAPQKFVLDKTRPVIEVIYNPAEHIGVDDMGTLHYNVNTTATVRIKEHNFRANDVISEFNNGKNLGTFNDGGNDSHSASVLFDQNNRYHFRISYTDLAGNVADPYSSPIFSVDTTPPVIDITEGDMTNEHLNIVPDDLVLQIRVMDQESNLESYTVKITYQNNSFEWITLNSGDYWTVTSEDGGNTIYINFANILKEKSKDGIYTVEVSGRDYAGNVTELTPPLVFSLNRFGSSFMSRDPFTIDFLRTGTEGIAYHNSVDQRLVFQEINPNRVFEDAEHKLEGSALTLMVNGASRRLQREQDYTVTREEHNAEDQGWFVYTYTIEPAAFMDGGELRNGRNTILIYGEDEAGNQNTNESNTPEITNLADGEMYTGKIEFVLDTTPPIITTVGIESNGVYEAESQQMKIDVSDSTHVAVKVYLNDQELTLSQESGDNSVVWMTRDETMGTYTVNVPQDNNLFAKQTLRVTVVDAANNEAEAYVREFYVTTNPFTLLMNNIWLLGVGVLVLAGAIFLTVVTIRKRKTKAAK